MSLARPGGNVTGLSMLSREVAGKQLAMRRPSTTLADVTPDAGDLDGAATCVALAVPSDKAGAVGDCQCDCFRLLEADLKIQSETRVAVRARQTLFEESANVARRATRGRCHG